MMLGKFMNERMRLLLAQADRVTRPGVLSTKLQDLVAAGLAVRGGRLFFARELVINERLVNEFDDTGAEALVIKILLDELVALTEPDWAVKCVSQGLLLGHEVASAAKALRWPSLEMVISVDVGGDEGANGEPVASFPSSTFRFYTRRDGNPWLQEDLDGSTRQSSCFGQPADRHLR